MVEGREVGCFETTLLLTEKLIKLIMDLKCINEGINSRNHGTFHAAKFQNVRSSKLRNRGFQAKLSGQMLFGFF